MRVWAVLAATIMHAIGNDTRGVGRRTARPLLADCVWEAVLKYPQCDVLKELDTGTTEITPKQVDALCFNCLATVSHALSIDAAGVCDETLQWASQLSNECAQVDIVQEQCPDIDTEGTGCKALADLDVVDWSNLAPGVPIPLDQLIAPCTECLTTLDADLSRCPRERYFASSVQLICRKVIASDCISRTFPQAFPGNPCGPTTNAMRLYQADTDLIAAAQTCDTCLPYFQDQLPFYKPQECPDAPLEWTVNMRLQCTGSSEAETVCVAEFLRGIPECSRVASLSLGFKIEEPYDACRACLDLAIARAPLVASCPSLTSTLAGLDKQCNRGGFIALTCSDLFTWTQGNHTYPTPPPGNGTVNATATITVTPDAGAGTSVDANGTLPANSTAAPPTPVPLTPAPTPAPRVPGPCEIPFSCECAEHFDNDFEERWGFYLNLCGLVVERRKRDCFCAEIAADMYAAVPQCDNLFTRPDLFTLCTECYKRRPDILPYIRAYDACTGLAKGMQVYNGLDSMCGVGGLGTGGCPNALTTGLSTAGCEGAFEDMVGLALTGAPISGVARGLVCKNGTTCSTALLNRGALADELLVCGVDVVQAHKDCGCLNELDTFLDAAPACSVLVGEQWRVSAQNFTRLCASCLPDASLRRESLRSYGACIRKGYWFSTDLIANMQASCTAAEAAAAPALIEPVSDAVYQSACLAPAGAGRCRAATMCAVETHIPGCNLLARHPHWMLDAAKVDAVCDACVVPGLKIHHKGTTAFYDMTAGERAAFEVVQAAMACDLGLWDLTALRGMCAHRPGVESLCAIGGACPTAVPMPDGCPTHTLEHLGARWSQCLYRQHGKAQCTCTTRLLAELPDACRAHPAVTDMLCRVRQQGCPFVPYPNATGAECVERKERVTWNTMPLQTAYALCTPEDLNGVYEGVAECADGAAENLCMCIAGVMADVPEPCGWDEAGRMLQRLLCVFEPQCGGGAASADAGDEDESTGGASDPHTAYPVSRAVCDAFVAAYRAELVGRSEVERVHAAPGCHSGLSRVAARVAGRWDACGVAGVTTVENHDACDCLARVHRDMALLSVCAEGSPEWEVLRCIALTQCAARPPSVAYFPPERPQHCQLLMEPPTDAHDADDYTPSARVFADVPTCDWRGLAGHLADFDACIAAAAPNRTAKCRCVAELSWALPAPCKTYPSAVWTHVRCIASDLFCTSVPQLQATACDRFHIGLLRDGDGLRAGTATSEDIMIRLPLRATAVAAVNSYLAGTMPARCASSRAITDAVETCAAGAVFMHDAGAFASDADPRGTALQSAVCGCLLRTHLEYAGCTRWQAGALNDVACLAVEWRCYGFETHARHCPAIGQDIFMTSDPRVCPDASALAAARHARPQATCGEEAAFRMSLPYPCRAGGAVAVEYHTSLCASLAMGCGVAEIPRVFCGRVGGFGVPKDGNMSAPSAALFHQRGRCRALSMYLREQCAPVFAIGTVNPVVYDADAIRGVCRRAPCMAVAHRFRDQLNAECLREERVVVNWIAAACTTDAWGGLLAAPARPLYFKLRDVLVTPRQDMVLVRRPAGIGAALAASYLRWRYTGAWEGLPVLHGYTWEPPTAGDAVAWCTTEASAALRGITDVFGMSAGERLCSMLQRGGRGEAIRACVADAAAWEWGSYTGGAARCRDRCYRKSLREGVAAAAPTQRAVHHRLAQLVCEVEPAADESCEAIYPEYLSGVSGTIGARFPSHRTTYSVEACAQARQGFEQCRRSRQVPLCECIAILANALPSRQCLLHVDVAPTTLCLLQRSDLCRSKEYYHEVREYCADPMYEELRCLEMLENPELACSQGCRRAMTRYKENWQCCASSIDGVFGLQDRGDVLAMMERCAVTPYPACNATVANMTFFARLVFDFPPEDYTKHEHVFLTALKADVVDLLGMRERNIVAHSIGSTGNDMVLGRKARTLQTPGRSDDMIYGERTYTTVGFYIAGDRSSDTLDLQADFLAQLGRGVALETFAAATVRLLKRPVRLHRELSGAATELRPLVELKDTVGPVVDRVNPVAILFAAAPVSSPCGLITAITAAVVAVAFGVL